MLTVCGACWKWKPPNKKSEEEKESEGLAGLKSIAVRVVGGFSRRRKARTKKIKVEDKLMDLWHKMIFPVRRVWLSVSARVKARKNGPSLLSFSSAYIFPRKSAAFFLVCSLFLIYFLFILFNLYMLQKLFFKEPKSNVWKSIIKKHA